MDNEEEKTKSTLIYLECSNFYCKKIFKDMNQKLYNLCPICEKPLFAIYDLKKASKTMTKESSFNLLYIYISI